MSKNAIVYCRTAALNEITNERLALQERICRAYAKSKGLQVIKSVKDVGSGRNINLGLSKLIKFVKGGAVNYVVAFSPDRISRKPVDYYVLQNLLKRHNAQFMFVNGDSLLRLDFLAEDYLKLFKTKK